MYLLVLYRLRGFSWLSGLSLKRLLLFISCFSVLQGMHLYIPYFSKCGEPWSPGFSNHTCNRDARLKKPHETSLSRFVQLKNKCSLAMQKTLDRFVHHKSERLASSSTLAKAISRNSCPSNLPLVHNTCGSLVCDSPNMTEVFVFWFASYSALSICPTSPPSCYASSHAFLPAVTAKEVHRVLSHRKVSKPPGPGGFLSIILKMFFSWVVIFATPSLSFFSQSN